MYFRFQKSTSKTGKSKRWTEDHINDALKEINDNRTSIQETGKQYINSRVNSAKKKRYAQGGHSTSGLWFKNSIDISAREAAVALCWQALYFWI